MEEATNLIRTTVRAVFPKETLSILCIDLVLQYRILSIDELNLLLNCITRETRGAFKPLQAARLVSMCQLLQKKDDGNPHTRPNLRDHFYIDFRRTVDTIKYRVMKLRQDIEQSYAEDETKRKEWLCPHCKAEYEELEVLDKIGDEGFYCDRCGTTLISNEAANRDRGSHEKIRRLNEQLKKLDSLIISVDDKIDLLPTSLDPTDETELLKLVATKIPIVWAKERPKDRFITVSKKTGGQKILEQIKAENLDVTITSGADQEREERERQEQRRLDMAQQNQMPLWYVQSAVTQREAAVAAADGLNGIKNDDEDVNGVGVKKEEDDEDERKPDVAAPKTAREDEYAAYLAEMEREAEDAKRKEEAENSEADEEEDYDVGDFEDVMSDQVETPSVSQLDDGKVADVKSPPPLKNGGSNSNGMKTNGAKRGREVDDDDEEESSEANTPASMKRVKVEQSSANGVPATEALVKTEDIESEEDDDEGDFEDAL